MKIPFSVANQAAARLGNAYGVNAKDIIDMFSNSPMDLSEVSVGEVVEQVKEWFRETDREYRRAQR